MTVNLKLRYRKPTPLDSFIVFRSEVTQVRSPFLMYTLNSSNKTMFAVFRPVIGKLQSRVQSKTSKEIY